MIKKAGLIVTTALVGLAAASCNDRALLPLGDVIQATEVMRIEDVASNQVDILWVVDSSGSMSEEQAQLGANFASFIDSLAEFDADFNIAVVDTDTGSVEFATAPGRSKQASPPCSGPVPGLTCPPLDGVLRAADYSLGEGQGFDVDRLRNDFVCLATVGDCGNGFERGLAAMQSALDPQQPHLQNSNFLRDSAFLAVIFVTDEDDCTTDGSWSVVSDQDCYIAGNRDRMAPVQDFYDFLVTDVKEDPAQVLVAGIIGPDDLVPPPNPGETIPVACISQIAGEGEQQTARAGDRYRELIEMFNDTELNIENGIESSICQGNFSDALREIGRRISSNLQTCLRQPPRQCSSDADCDGACLDFSGLSVCDDFEVHAEIELDGEFTVYANQGPVSTTSDCTGGNCQQTASPQGTQFEYRLGDQSCPSQVSYQFLEGNRPPRGSVIYLSYPSQIDVQDGGETEEVAEQ